MITLRQPFKMRMQAMWRWVIPAADDRRLGGGGEFIWVKQIALQDPCPRGAPYKILPDAKRAMEDVVAQRLALFHSNGRS